MTFAKIFDSSKYGQILAKRDTNDEGARVVFHFELPNAELSGGDRQRGDPDK